MRNTTHTLTGTMHRAGIPGRVRGLQSRTRAVLCVSAIVLASCGGDDTPTEDGVATRAEVAAPPIAPVPTTADDVSAVEDGGSDPAEVAAAVGVYTERLDLLVAAVADWSDASSIEEAHAAAETAANLVVGPNGPGYGDRDGDGAVLGVAEAGLLPGLDGTPMGLASALGANECVARDVLGGSWDDPGDRWDVMLATIDAWRPDDNTMPSLPSHLMRIVGWSTFTLRSDDLDDAHEYAGHAQLHVDVSRDALTC